MSRAKDTSLHAMRDALVTLLAGVEGMRDRKVPEHLWHRLLDVERAARGALVMIPRIDGRNPETEVR